jgi:ATP-dependent helicase/nuclease subunit B
MCDFVCADIKRHISAGERYSDFAIVAKDAQSYSGILDLSLKKYKIPAFTSYKRQLDGFAAVKLIFAAYSAIDGGMRREDVIAYAKCGFTELSRDELDELEAYVNKWQIDGSRFLDEDDWHMNPMGYENRKPDNLPQILARINAARRTLITPLASLKESVRSCKTVKEHAGALVEFLVSIGLRERLYERALSLGESGDYESAAELERLLKAIGAPCSVEEIGLSADILRPTFEATKDIRDKYVLSRLCWDLGILEDIQI